MNVRILPARVRLMRLIERVKKYMDPQSLALGLLVNYEFYRRLATEAMVRQDGIVSQQPVDKVPFKGFQVVKQ